MTYTRDTGRDRWTEPVAPLFPITERLNDGVVVVNGADRICWVNGSMETLFGISPRNAVGQDRTDVIGSRVVPLLQGRKDAAISLFFPEGTDPVPGRSRFSIISPAGRKRHIEYSCLQVKTADFPGYRFEFFRDISGTDAPIHDLSFLVEDFHALIAHFPRAYYIIEGNGTIIDGSAATEEITGFSPVSLAGMRLQTSPLLSRDQMVRTARFIEDHFRGRREKDGSFLITRKDGRRVHVSFVPFALRISGTLLIIGVRHDRPADARAADNVREDVRNPEFLSRAAHEILDLAPGSDYYGFIASRLGELCPGALIFISSVNEEARCLRVESVSGADTGFRSSFADLLGFPPEGLTFSLPDEETGEMLAGTLVEIPGVEALTFGAWPEDVCRRFATLCQIGSIHGIGLAWKGRLYGNAIIIRKESAGFPDRTIIEAFIGLVALALQRRQAEEELRKSRELYSNIFESMNDAVAVIDRNFRTTLWNRAMEEFIGISRERIVGTPLLPWEIYPGVTEERIIQLLDPVWHGNVVRRDGYAVRLPSGKDGNITDTFLPLKSPEGGIEGAIIIISDITEKTLMIDALRQSEEKYRELVENANSIILRTDTDGCITFFNEFAERFFGFCVDEVMGRSVFETIVPETELAGRNLREHLGQMYRTPDLFTASENENVRKDGTRVWIAWRNRAIYSENGKFAGFLSVGNDVTERKAANVLIRENEVKYRTLFASAHDGISLLKEGRYIDCNAEYEHIFGCPVSEIIGRAPEDFSPERQPGGRFSVELAQDYQERALAGQPEFFAWRHLRRDGTSVDTEVSLTRMEIPGEALLLAVVRDITERAKAEDALRESEVRYRTTIDSMGDPVHVIDRTFEILLVNRAFKLWFDDLDLSPDVIAKHITQAFPTLSEDILDEYRWVFETGEMLLGKEKMRFGETEYVVETRKIPVFEHGEVVRVVTVIRDITSSEKLEKLKFEAFVQIEKNMEQFAILNDHIRNPLQAIVGLADLEGGDLAEKIYQQAMEIDAIIKQLDIGWIESKKIREFLRKHYGIS